MLRQSKPMSRAGPSDAVVARSFLLSLDYEGTGRYPVPGSGVRRAEPLDHSFLMAATRDPIIRPTHKSLSSDTVGSTSTRSAASSTNSPTRSPRETTVGAPWDRSPLSMKAVPEAYDGIDMVEDEQEILEDASEPNRTPGEQATCSHNAGLKGSIRRKLGRNAPCSRCGEVPMKPLQRQGSWVGRSLSLRGRATSGRAEVHG
ncbi:unnamed protein product [Cutaneotrichosporon oleaginosum]